MSIQSGQSTGLRDMCSMSVSYTDVMDSSTGNTGTGNSIDNNIVHVTISKNTCLQILLFRETSLLSINLLFL